MTTSNPMYQSIAQQVGTTDEVTTCSCCNRQWLKRTVVFRTKESWQEEGGDEYIFLGTTCASIARAASYGRIKERTDAVNRYGRTATEQAMHDEQIAIGAAFVNKILATGRSLEDAMNIYHQWAAMPNGLYRMKLDIAA